MKGVPESDAPFNPFTRVMKKLILHIFFTALILFATASCSNEEEVRTPADITGVWEVSKTTFIQFNDNYTAYNLTITEQDDKFYGLWIRDAYFYEPGYNLVIYMDANNEAKVYQIVSMNSASLTWCEVDKIVAADIEGGMEGVGQVIGDIIKKAQEGYKLNPELFKSMKKVSNENFFDMLERLGIDYPFYQE